MARLVQNALQRAWELARAGRGELVLIAGADTDAVTAAVALLVADATRDGARVRTIRDAPTAGDEPDALVAQDGFDAAMAVASQLRSESASATQLVVLERVERAAPRSLRLLAVLGRELRDAAVLVLATRGDAAVAADADRDRALADLARAGRWVTLDLPAVPDFAADTAPIPVTLVRHGGYWRLERGGQRVTLRDARGLHHLAKLIAEPGRSWRALDLTGGVDEDGGETLDASARAAYRRELAALDRSDAGGDAAFLERTLARDTGLGGRARRIDSSAERARGAVTRSIRRAIEAVREQDEVLGRWLAASVHTGHECRFEPAR